MTDGVVVVDKPTGMTSHDVVDFVRRRLGTRRVGHAGTLDPDATGVLVLGVGRATRFLAYTQDAPKRYTAVARFGVSTTTQDASGEVVEERPADISSDDVAAALPEFTGEIEQVPPMVSAVKVEAPPQNPAPRRGQQVEREARTRTVFHLKLVDFVPGEYPQATFDVACSAGTYIRTLVHDLGRYLSCGAHLESLRRTESGGFSLSDAVPLEEVSSDALRPLGEVVHLLPRIVATPEVARRVVDGRPLEEAPSDVAAGEHVAVVASDGELLAVYRKDDGRMVAERVVGAEGRKG
jgi:tRNA pseudouridine55 synthase